MQIFVFKSHLSSTPSNSLHPATGKCKNAIGRLQVALEERILSTYLITGANGGIGTQLCQQLQNRGEDVIAVCRQSSDSLDRLGVRIENGIDITQDDSVATLAQKLQGTSIDVLINNAGVMETNTLNNLNFDSLRRQYEVNTLGTLRVTQALLNNLHAGSKIAIITSRMGSIGDNTSGGYYGYRMSKAAVSMAGKSLSEDLKSRQISVGILHPGLVSTKMTDYTGIPPEQAAKGLIERIDQLNTNNTGTFWHANGEVLPW